MPKQPHNFICSLKALGRLGEQFGQVGVSVEALGIEFNGPAQVRLRFVRLALLAKREAQVGRNRRAAGLGREGGA